MALSSWDTLAVDLNGEPQEGFFVSPDGVQVSIYKNWIYVDDPKAWREKGNFTKSTIMEMHHGDIHYHDVEIRAIRGPQYGVYVACWHADYSCKPAKFVGMIGCGVSGYAETKDDEDPIWVGVTPESVEFLQKWISHKERHWTDEEVDEMVAGLNNPDLDPKDWEKELKESCNFDFPEEIAGVSLGKGIRYNQGNMYFAEKSGMPLEATEPGESEEPAISQMLK